MASPSASSVTLSLASSDDEVPMDIDSPEGGWEPPSDQPPFVLPEEYTYVGTREDLSPSMKAASNPDPRVLKTVLSDGRQLYDVQVEAEFKRRQEEGESLFPSGDRAVGYYDFPFSDMSLEYGSDVVRVNEDEIGITSPLMEAIRAELPENVKILLEAGANPNGVPLSVMEDYAAFFLRFRPRIPHCADEMGDVASREVLLKCIDLPQISSLTWEEVEDRFVDGMAPFWCEEKFIPKDYYRHGDSMSSLVEAAGTGSVEIFDLLLDNGTDASFWMRPHIYVPTTVKESTLSVSSPLHAAIRGRKTEMLRHLLELGFDPNTMPLINPTRCFTPLMATLLHVEEFNKEAFDILASQTNINFELRTPIYDVHILHFAVARHDINTLKHVSSKIPLKNAGVTALGHTLLHIACLPATSTEVQRHSEDIRMCIHETRDLHTTPDPYIDANSNEGHWAYFENFTVHHHRSQNQIIKFLWDNGSRDFEKKDVHGNTALHYLAAYKKVNWGILEWLFEQNEAVERIWREGDGELYISPEELAFSGERVEREGTKDWKPWFDRNWTEDRMKRKQEAWKDLLDGKTRRSMD